MSEIQAVGKVKKWLMLASMTGFNSVSLLSNLKFFQGKTLKALQKKYELLRSK